MLLLRRLRPPPIWRPSLLPHLLLRGRLLLRRRRRSCRTSKLLSCASVALSSLSKLSCTGRSSDAQTMCIRSLKTSECILNNLTSPAVLPYPVHRTTDELSANRYERVNTTAMRGISYVSPAARWTRARRAVGLCVCVRLWPLCAPVNRSQCARGRQNWNSTPPHLAVVRSRSDRTSMPRWTMPDLTRGESARAEPADLSACAWSWWRGARALPARPARGPAAHCRTHCAMCTNWRARVRRRPRGERAAGPGSAARGPRRVTNPSALWV